VLATALTSDTGGSLDFGFNGKQSFTGYGDGKSNGNYTAVKDERSAGVGIYNNLRHKWLIKPLKYSQLDITDMDGVIATLYKNDKVGMIDAWTGDVLVPFEYARGEAFGEGGLKLFYENRDKSGECVIYEPDDSGKAGKWKRKEGNFRSVTRINKNSRKVLLFEQNGKKGVMLPNGKYAVEPAYEDIVPISGDIEDRDTYCTRITTGWGLQAGEKLILPHNYQMISVGYDNKYSDPSYVIAQENGASKIAAYTPTGKMLIKPVFDNIERFTSSLVKDKKFFKVKSGDKYGLYTEDGVMAVPPVCADDKALEIRMLTYEQDSYNIFVRRKVAEMASTKGEFEKTADFEARQKDSALQEKYILENIGDTKADFVKWQLQTKISPRNPHKLSISAYDADKECFYVSDSATPHHNPYMVRVPVSEAPRFKEEFPSISAKAMEGAAYTVIMDTMAVEKMGFTTSDGNFYWLTK